jgi:hypothetical protein
MTHARVFRDIVAVAELMETCEAHPIGLQSLRDVRADESLKEENLFFKGGAGPLRRAVRNEAVRRCPHEVRGKEICRLAPPNK